MICKREAGYRQLAKIAVIMDHAIWSATHLSGGTGDNMRIIVQMGIETPIWHILFDQAGENQEILISQKSSWLEVYS